MNDYIQSKKLVVTQANCLAHGIQKMTLQEKRLLLLVMAFVRKDDDEFKSYHLPVKQVGQYLNIKTNALYLRLNDIADKLLTRVVEIRKPDGGWVKFQWVSRAEYVPSSASDDGIAKLLIRLHPDLKPNLLKLTECFGSMPFSEVAGMKRYTSIRMFEILYFQSRRSNHTLTFELEPLKNMLGLNGEYSQFSDFEKRVLIPAKEECSKLTNLSFSYQVKRAGRKVVGLIFQVERKKQKLEQSENLDSDVVKKLQQAGFTGNTNKLLEEHDEQAILDAITLAKRRQSESMNTGNPIHNLGGLIVKILADGAHEVIAQERSLAKEKQAKVIAATQTDQEAQKQSNEKFKAVETKWQSLTETEQSSIHDWIKSQANKAILKIIESANWQGQMYRAERFRAMQDLGFV